MLGWELFRLGGLLTICSSRVGAYSRGANSRICGSRGPEDDTNKLETLSGWIWCFAIL